MLTFEFNCPKCNTPIPITQETTQVTCPGCAVNIVFEDQQELSAVTPDQSIDIYQTSQQQAVSHNGKLDETITVSFSRSDIYGDKPKVTKPNVPNQPGNMGGGFGLGGGSLLNPGIAPAKKLGSLKVAEPVKDSIFGGAATGASGIFKSAQSQSRPATSYIPPNAPSTYNPFSNHNQQFQAPTPPSPPYANESLGEINIGEIQRKVMEEAQRQIQAEVQRQQAMQEEFRRQAYEQAKRDLEIEARIKAEEEARLRAEQEAYQRAVAERLRLEAERLKAEEEVRQRAIEMAKQRAIEEAKQRAIEAAKQKAIEEAKKRAEEEAKKKAAEETKIETVENKEADSAAKPAEEKKEEVKTEEVKTEAVKTDEVKDSTKANDAKPVEKVEDKATEKTAEAKDEAAKEVKANETSTNIAAAGLKKPAFKKKPTTGNAKVPGKVNKLATQVNVEIKEEPELDEQGNPKLDEEGKPIMKKVQVSTPAKTVRKGLTLEQKKELDLQVAAQSKKFKKMFWIFNGVLLLGVAGWVIYVMTR